MLANYHTHTMRCRHARGNEEEYIRAALQAGMKELGFSDHAPQPFKGSYYSKMRMYPWQLEEYVQTLQELRQEYAGQIDIHIGLETEYYPDLFDELLGWARDAGVEYMILGQHWPGNEEGEPHVYQPFDEYPFLVRVADQMLEAMYTGMFTYVAHPDLPRFLGDDRLYRQQMRRIIQGAKRCGLPLEINLHGLRCGCAYPDERFWEVVAEEDCPVILGADAHDPEELLDTEAEARMLNMVRRLHLNLLDTVPLRRL